MVSAQSSSKHWCDFIFRNLFGTDSFSENGDTSSLVGGTLGSARTPPSPLIDVKPLLSAAGGSIGGGGGGLSMLHHPVSSAAAAGGGTLNHHLLHHHQHLLTTSNHHSHL